MGNPPTDERPKRMDFWLTAKTREILDAYPGNKADYVNRAILAYHQISSKGGLEGGHQVDRPKLIFDSIEDLVIINILPFNHPGDQRWIRPLASAVAKCFLKPYAFLYNPRVNVEQQVLIPMQMEKQWRQFLAQFGCELESKQVVSKGVYIDFDDKLNSIIELVNERGGDPTKKAICWIQEN